jgi:putative ABC transport system permease protein
MFNLQNFRYIVRSLSKTPGFSIAAIVILALGIGANTAIFSIVDAALLRPLPFDQPDRLVQLFHTPPQQQFPGTKTFALSAANYLDWQQRNDVFEKSAIYNFTSFRLTAADGEPEELQAGRVEPTYFDVVRGHLALGRALNDNDGKPGNEHVAVIGYRLWQSRFAGDPQIVGKSIALNGQTYSVVGVAADDFRKPDYAQLWVPLVWDAQEKTVRGEHHFSAVARLKPGVSVASAQAQLDSISSALAQQYPADDAGWGALVMPLREATVGDIKKPLFVLLGVVAFVLLIACANVANLILAKTLDRKKEIAIRTALGARRVAIMRQILAESIALSICGGLLGLGVAHFAVKIVTDYLGALLPHLVQVKLDLPVLAFTLGVALFTGIAAGFIPSWRMSAADPQDALKQGGRSGSAGMSQATRNGLVIGEVALSLVLLVGAGLMVRTLWNLRSIDPGFDPAHALTASINVTANDYGTPQQELVFMDEALRRLRALPGVESAGFTDSLPLQDGSTQPVSVQGQEVVDMSHQPEVSVRMITPGFFSALHVPVTRGRDFNDQDNATSLPVVVVSEAMARQFWPGQDPIGKRLTLTFFPNAAREVVGVVADVKERGLDYAAPVSTLYWPMAQFYKPESMGSFHGIRLQLALRTGNDPLSATSAVRETFKEIAPELPVREIRTMQSIVDESLSSQRFTLFLLAAFAGLAMLLAGVGIYSVLAYTVRQRVREIGMRMALGAQPRDLLRKFVMDGFKPTLAGVAIGIVVALVLARVLGSLVFGVQATDFMTLCTVSLLLTAVGLVASAIPAWRATRVSPLAALRDE